ncbi:MAG: GatB/YqeY domain-containing protein [Chthoniobacteraceae bacterium]
MNFQERIDNDLKEAMKARETERLNVLRMLKAALKNLAIEKGGLQFQLEEADALAVVRKQVKQRHDSIEGFEKGGRPELAEKEKSELKILQSYLPQQLSEEELSALVKEAIAEAGATSKQQLGAVMKLANAKAAGRAEGKAISAEVQKQLS